MRVMAEFQFNFDHRVLVLEDSTWGNLPGPDIVRIDRLMTLS